MTSQMIAAILFTGGQQKDHYLYFHSIISAPSALCALWPLLHFQAFLHPHLCYLHTPRILHLSGPLLYSILLFITFLSYVSCSVTYTFELPTGYWSYLVTWQRNTTNDEHGKEGQPLTEEETLAIRNIYDEDEETLIEDEDHLYPYEDHLYPYEDEESKQVLPFQRTGDMDWNPMLQTWEQRGSEGELVFTQNDWDMERLRWAQDDWATHPSTPEPPPP